MRLRTGTKIVLALLGACGGAVYYGYINRAHTMLDKGNWHLEFSYIRMACRTCSGYVEKLEYYGRPFGNPTTWQGGCPTNYLDICTPVGKFKWFAQIKHWRLDHAQLPSMAITSHITPQELERGFYDLDPPHTTTQPYRHPRKSGTPASWCLGVPMDWRYERWFDPALIDKLTW